MNFKQIINEINTSYCEKNGFIITAIIDDGDVYIFQVNRKDGIEMFGGIKNYDKKTGEIKEVNPFSVNGLINRLMTEGIENMR